MSQSDLERLRIARAEREIGEVPSIDAPTRFVGRVTSTSPNLVVGKFINVAPQVVTGSEAEGQAGTFTDAGDGTRRIPVMLLGPGVPAGGDRILVRSSDHRWVSRRKSSGTGAGQGTLLGCTCAHPPLTLTMTSSSAGCSNGLFHSDTITYQATPAALASLRFGAFSYLGDTYFNDAQTGDQWRYYLACFSSIIRISRVFETSVYGSPFLDGVIYFWTLGLPGNTCSPFSLANGTVFAGGDTSCTLTITG